MTKSGLVLTSLFFTLIWHLHEGNNFILFMGRQHDQNIDNGNALFLSRNIFLISTDTVPKSSLAEPQKKDDAFSRLMAGVVNDTAILFNTYIDIIPKKDPPKKETAGMPEVKNISLSTTPHGKKMQQDSIIKKAEPSNKIEKGKTPVAGPNPMGSITKLSERSSDSSLQLVFTAITKRGKKDTIILFIPFEKINLTPKQQTDTLKNSAELEVPKKDTIQDYAKSKTPGLVKPEEKSNLLSRDRQPASNQGSVDSVSAAKNTAHINPIINSNCKNLATDYDVDKLRVKMLAVENDDDKVQMARKFFKIKCFRTIQIRALSEAFPTDEGRYKFLDAAYPFAYDYTNYPQLAGLLTGQYYINRFNAMIKQ